MTEIYTEAESQYTYLIKCINCYYINIQYLTTYKYIYKLILFINVFYFHNLVHKDSLQHVIEFKWVIIKI